MLNVTLTLTPEQQAQLQAGLDRRDAETVRRVLLDAVEPTVAILLEGDQERLSIDEFLRLTDQLVAQVAARLPPDWEGLPDEAISREGIYGDHP